MSDQGIVKDEWVRHSRYTRVITTNTLKNKKKKKGVLEKLQECNGMLCVTSTGIAL